MSVAVNAPEFPILEQGPAPTPARKGLLSRLFNAAVKAAPTAAASAALGFTLRTAALSGAVAAGASTGITLAAIAAASGTTAALVTAGKEAWTARKDGRSILETLSSRDLLKKVRNNFALAAGFGALGATVAPLVIDYVKYIDFSAVSAKIGNFFIPAAAAFDYNHGDLLVPPGARTSAEVLIAKPSSAPVVAQASQPQSAPAEFAPASPAKPATPPASAPPETSPPPAKPSAPVRSVNPLDRARELIAQTNPKGAAKFGDLETMTPQQLKDAGVKALWQQKNPALARALFEASGNGQARQALAFMDKHSMGLPKGGTAAATAEASPLKPAAAPVEKGPGTRPHVAAKCAMTYPPMEGLTFECDVKKPTMYPGDRIDVVDATNRPATRGKLTQIFYEGTSKLRTLAEAISTNSFLKGRVAPVFIAADPGIQEYIEKGYVTHPNKGEVNLALK